MTEEQICRMVEQQAERDDQGPLFDHGYELGLRTMHGLCAKALSEPMAALLAGLKQMIEAGRLTEADIPDDFEWLCEAMRRAGRKVEVKQEEADD